MKKLALLFAIFPTIIVAQHTVKGTFSPSENFTYAILYHSTPSSLNYVNRDRIKGDGSFKIALDSTINAGMYKIVYGIPQDEHNFDFIYDGKEDIVLTFSLENGLDFKESKENKLWASYTKSMELVNMTISNYYTQESTDKKAFRGIFQTLNDTQVAFEEASKGTLAATFILANKPYIPKEYEDLTTYSNNLKSTFLKRVDFGNQLLQSSDFLSDRVLAYVFGMSASADNEDYKNQIDAVAASIGVENPVIATTLLEEIWSRMIALENTEVAAYISDTYLFKLAKETDNTELYKLLMTSKNSALGTVAMDFPITYEADGKPINTSLHQLSGAEYYLLIFWSSTCAHCLGELPKIKSYLDSHSKNLKVVAFGLEDEKANWSKTIIQLPTFIHVLGLEHWDNPVALAYGINSTPTYFLLDKDKKIIDKPKDLETLKKSLENLK